MEHLISYRFAVIVISILLGASAAGWILTELIPPDFPERMEFYRERWGAAVTRLIEAADLYDPFHSIWYRAVLALFLVVLSTCLLTRWRQFIRRSLGITIPGGVEQLEKRKLHAEIEIQPGMNMAGGTGQGQGLSPPDGGGEELIEETARFFRKRGYTMRVERGDRAYLFAAVKGRWRFLGNFLFHLGILVITIGAVIGSFWGGSGFVYGRAGDRLPLPGSSDSLLVEDFRILVTETGEIRDFISTISILSGEGGVVSEGDIEVNHPMRYGVLNIYQSSYFAAENEFVSAAVSLSEEGKTVTLEPGGNVMLSDLGLLIEPGRFLPDFRMGKSGPFSASLSMQNPALEIVVKGMSRTERGWLFLNHPGFNSRFTLPVNPSLVEIEPVYYTGMQVSYNPGEHVLLAGFLFGTIGLILLYFLNYRVIGGALLDDRLVLAGLEYRWKVGFGEEFDSMRTELKERFEKN